MKKLGELFFKLKHFRLKQTLVSLVVITTSCQKILQDSEGEAWVIHHRALFDV
jgi:hypothetical protein